MDFRGIKEKETFILGDGEIVAEVIENIGQSQLLCRSKNTGMVGYGKACYFKRKFCEHVTREKLYRYKELIGQLKPEFIALSFVESVDDISKIKEWLPKKTKVIAKIETEAGVLSLK